MPQSAARRPARRAPVPVRRRRGWRPGLRIAAAVSLAVLAAGGIGDAALGGIDDGIGRVDAFAGLGHRPPPGRGENFLLVGTDGRERIPAGERAARHLGGTGCDCADTLMLAHLSRDRSRLTVVSLPRDSLVRLPAAGGRAAGPAKLNAAYRRGGPRLTVAAVERITGLRLDHYLELDFVSFVRTVDALGGVPVCADRPLRDPKSGLDLPAGTTLLDGGRALDYVRARYVDGSADLGRMARQQRFLTALLSRASGSGVLRDPARLGAVVRDTLASVRADRELAGKDLVGLAEAAHGLTPAAVTFASVPAADLARRVPGAGTTVVWDTVRAARLFAALRADRPLPLSPSPAARRTGRPVDVDPGTVRVTVDGGGGDAAARTAAALRATGFAARPAGPRAPGRTGSRTVIAYDPGRDRSARSLAAALPSAVLRPVHGLGPVLRVTLGQGRAAVVPVRPGSDAPPAPGTVVSGARETCG